jgi:hypothetical protein
LVANLVYFETTLKLLPIVNDLIKTKKKIGSDDIVVEHAFLSIDTTKQTKLSI